MGRPLWTCTVRRPIRFRYVSEWMLFDSLVAKHRATTPLVELVRRYQLNLFTSNNMYSPPSQWIWHPRAAFSEHVGRGHARA